MRYAVTTHSFFFIVELNDRFELTDFELIDKGYFYGMTFMPLPSHSKEKPLLAVYKGGYSVFTQDKPEIVFYESLPPYKEIDRIPLKGDIGDVHQIAYANGGLYITNSAYNSLVFYDINKGIEQEYLFGEKRMDWNHLNSVFPGKDQVLVMLHNLTRKESEIAVLSHDKEKGFKLVKKLSLWHIACHNHFIDGRYLFYNASPGHSSVMVDIKKNEIVRQLTFHGHIKGLSVTDNHIAIGISEDTFRDKRFQSKGQLAILDRKNFSVINIIDLISDQLPHPVGNMNEIRCLSEFDHSQSIETSFQTDWDTVTLARNKMSQFIINRLKTKSLLPLRNGKKKVRQLLKLNRDH